MRTARAGGRHLAFGTALLSAAWLPGAVAAQDVVLTSRDGSVEISGTLLSYDGAFYRVDTVYGALTLDGQGVICTGEGCPDPDAFVAEFSISGAAAAGQVVMPVLLEAFAAARGLSVVRDITDDRRSTFLLQDPATGREQAAITLTLSDADEGFADLIAQEADLAISDREITNEEAEVADEAGQGDLRRPGRARVLALDALVPVVAPDNPLRQIDLETLARVFAGEITDWADLGGAPGPIALHLTQPRTGLRQYFDRRVLQRAVVRQVAGAVVEHPDAAELVDAVARDPRAIGISSWSELGNAEALALAGSCNAAITPGVSALKSDDYPLTRPILIYAPARRLPLMAREFLAFLNRPAAQVIIGRAGFVNQEFDRIPLRQQGDRLANAILSAGDEVRLPELKRLIDTLSGAERLSATFRFDGGSTALDTQSQGNVDRLARALETGAFAGREVLFLGFSDGSGPASANKAISLRRAEAARAAVLERAPDAGSMAVKLSVDGFGEAQPLACDENAWGRRVNRRVEVWVR